MGLLQLNSGNFDETIKSGRVLVDFWAGWCGPCRMVAPIIEELAGAYDGIVKVAKVDVDAENALASRYGVNSIPTVVLFEGGAEVKRFVGVQSKETYESVLKK